MRLFKPDAFAVITTDSERIDLSPVSEATGRRLNISFNCFLSEDADPNTGECTIYNLSETTRNKIGKGDKIELFAGYDGVYKLISIGDIETVNNRKPGTDWASKITWGDGIRAYLDSSFDKSYREGAKVADIMGDITKSLGLSVDLSAFENTQTINGGLSVTGQTKDILNKLTKDYGLEWSIQDDTVRIINEGKPIDDEAIVISQATGLLEFPQITEKGTDFVAQLQADLRPNKLVRIDSIESTIDPAINKGATVADSANGLNIVQTVRFVGDNFGGEFSAKCKCRQYDNG